VYDVGFFFSGTVEIAIDRLNAKLILLVIRKKKRN
jgi:hypothetical protein